MSANSTASSRRSRPNSSQRQPGSFPLATVTPGSGFTVFALAGVSRVACAFGTTSTVGGGFGTGTFYAIPVDAQTVEGTAIYVPEGL
jgi:hypothetical protein